MTSLNQALTAASLLVSATAPGIPVSAQDKDVSPPTEPWAAQTSFDHITLVWGAAPGVTEYRISPKGPGRSAVVQGRRYVVPFKGTEEVQYYVQAVDSKGRSSEPVAFNPVTPVTADARPERPSPPQTVSAAESSPGEITVTWTPVEGATAYFIGRAVHPQGQHTLCSLCSTATKYVDQDVKAGAEHIYTVAAITPAGTSQKTRSDPVTPSGEKGRPPVDFQAVLSSDTSITLRWHPVAGADRYALGRSINDGAFRPIATVSKTEYVYRINRGKPTVFRFELVPHSKGSALEPAKSNPIVVDSIGDPLLPPSEVVADVPPKGTVGFQAVRNSAESIRLTWPAVSGATRYTIKRSRDGGAFVPVGTLSKTQYLYSVKPDPERTVVYRFELISQGPKGDVAPPAQSDPITIDSSPFTPPADVADVPPKGTVGLQAVQSSSESITLTWPAVKGATRYIIKHSRDGGAFAPVATLSKTQYIYSVTPDPRRTTVYRFELISQGPKGDVAPPAQSDPITVDSIPFTPPADVADVPPKAAIDFRAVLTSPGLITLAWSPVAGATQYIIRRSRNEGGFVAIATVNKTEYLYRVLPVRTTEVLQFELLAEGPKGAAAEPAKSEAITVEPLAEPIPDALGPEPRTPPRNAPADVPPQED